MLTYGAEELVKKWQALRLTATKPIVVATKATGSAAPLSMARWLAIREGRPLHVITVLEPVGVLSTLPTDATGTPHLYDDQESSVATQIEEMVCGGTASVFRPRTDVAFGAISPTIARIARERDAALLVVGTGNATGAARSRRAREILRAAGVPVLLVPPGIEPRPIMRAVAAVDFSVASLRAANAVLPLLAEGGHLTLCHVKSAYRLNEADVATFDEQYAKRADELFGTLVRALDLPAGVTVSTCLLHGATAPQVIDLVARDAADILACGRRNRSALKSFFLGTVSAELVQNVGIPVLVMPEPLEGTVDIESELSGTERWSLSDWPTMLLDCIERHRGEHVRLELIAESEGDPCLVAQNYELLDIIFEATGAHVGVMLRDPNATNGQASVWIPGVRSLTIETSMAGVDRHLAFESERGHGALRFEHGDNRQ